MYSSASRRMSPIWWSLRPLTMVGTKTIFRPALLTFSMRAQLLFPQRFAARAPVDVVADAVELEVERVQAGFLALLGEFQVGEFQAVGGRLHVREAHLLGHPQHVQKARVDGRLAAGELHDAARPRASGCAAPAASCARFRNPARRGSRRRWRWRNRPGRSCCSGWSDRRWPGRCGWCAGCTGRNRPGRAGGGDGRVVQAAVVAEGPLLHLQVQFGVGIDDVAKLAVGPGSAFPSPLCRRPQVSWHQ